MDPVIEGMGFKPLTYIKVKTFLTISISWSFTPVPIVSHSLNPPKRSMINNILNRTSLIFLFFTASSDLPFVQPLLYFQKRIQSMHINKQFVESLVKVVNTELI